MGGNGPSHGHLRRRGASLPQGVALGCAAGFFPCLCILKLDSDYMVYKGGINMGVSNITEEEDTCANNGNEGDDSYGTIGAEGMDYSNGSIGAHGMDIGAHGDDYHDMYEDDWQAVRYSAGKDQNDIHNMSCEGDDLIMYLHIRLSEDAGSGRSSTAPRSASARNGR